MHRCTTMDLRHLEIVNLCDGARLGYASDLEFDRDCAQILALIIRGSGGFLGIGKEEDLYIPWARIECIGEDTILVRLQPGDAPACLSSPKKKRFFDP